MPGRAVPHEAGATVEEEIRRRDVLATQPPAQGLVHARQDGGRVLRSILLGGHRDLDHGGDGAEAGDQDREADGLDSGPGKARTPRPRRLSSTAVIETARIPTRSVRSSRVAASPGRKSSPRAARKNAIAIRLLGVRAESGRRRTASEVTAHAAKAARKAAAQVAGRRQAGTVERRSRNPGTGIT
jgi:hypothetical protein